MLDSPTKPATSLLGAPRRPLHVRIRGGARDGQIIKLNDTKCLVGSDPRCQVQLPGSSEIDCWILRGTARTVVRSLRPGLRVNGIAVNDAVVRAGDRIELGECSLNVLRPRRKKPRKTTAQLVAAPSIAPAANTELLERIDACEKGIGSQLSQVVTQLTVRNAELLEQLRRRSEPSTPDSSLQDAIGRQIEAQRSQLALEAQRLEARQTEFDASCRQTQQQLQSQLEEVAGRLQNLEEQRQAFDSSRRQWEEQRQQQLTEFQNQLDALSTRGAELDQQRTHIEEMQAALATQRQQLAAEQQSLAQQSAELAASREALEAERQALIEQALSKSNDAEITPEMIEERDKQQQALAERTAELDAWQSQLDTRARELEAREQQTVASDQAVAADSQQHEQLRAELESQQAALAVRMAEVDEARIAIDERAAAVEQEIERERELLSQVREQIAEERAELEHRKTAWLLEHAQQQAELDTRARDLAIQQDLQRGERQSLDELRHELESEKQQLAERARMQPTQAESDDSPSEDVFHRLQAAGILKSADSDAPTRQESNRYGDRQPETADGDDEVSIDQYMRSLLERTRQGSSRESESVVTSVLRSFTGAKAENEAHSPVSGEPRSAATDHVEPRPVRQQRRTSAELPQDISAMRELANLSAHAALAQHYRRQQQYAFGTKIGIFLIALAAGLFGLIQDVPRDSMYWYASLGSLLIAGLWGAQLSLIVMRILWTYRLPKSTIELPIMAEILETGDPLSCDESSRTSLEQQ